MIPEHYVWLAWASAFLIPWVGLFLAFPRLRKEMWWASLFTAPFGLTEPLFVPEYWNPPSLFDLAQRTGFDIESLLFCFGIGGVGAVLYNVIGGKRLVTLPAGERHAPAHRYHRLALLSPFLIFVALSPWHWNPIYPGILAMAGGAVATIACRRDLATKTWLGGVLFLAYYLVFLIGLQLSSPGYIERVWNLDALSGFGIFGFPIEELLFAATFGMYWSGVYEHYTWRALEGNASGRAPGEGDSVAPRRRI